MLTALAYHRLGQAKRNQRWIGLYREARPGVVPGNLFTVKTPIADHQYTSRMFDHARISTFTASATDSTVRIIRAQPNWLVRVLTMIVLLVVVLPLAVVLLAIVLLIAVVVVIVAGFRAMMARIRRWLPRDDGRSNVRVRRAE